MIGKLFVFSQVFFHNPAIVLQMMQLQFRCARFKWIQFLQDFHPQVEKPLLAFVFGISGHFDLDQFFLGLLFGIKDAVQLCALVTNPLLVDQGTALVKNLDHPAAADVQIIFHHGLGLVQDQGDFCDLEAVDLLE